MSKKDKIFKFGETAVDLRAINALTENNKEEY